MPAAEETYGWLVQLPVAAISLDFLGVPGGWHYIYMCSSGTRSCCTGCRSRRLRCGAGAPKQALTTVAHIALGPQPVCTCC